MKYGKIIGRAILGALAASVIPYQIKKDKQTGTVEVRSLLWGLKKTPHKEGEKKDHYAFAIPASGLDQLDEKESEKPEEEPKEEPAEEPAAEASAGE